MISYGLQDKPQIVDSTESFQLSEEVLLHIFSFLSPQDLSSKLLTDLKLLTLPRCQLSMQEISSCIK